MLRGHLIHHFLIVWLDLFLRNRFFLILQFLGNLLREFLGFICFSFPILFSSLFGLFEPDLLIDSPGAAPIFEIRLLD